jgi:hypothetical protein
MAIIQSYNKNFSGGIGDFIRGGVFLYRKCPENLFIDFKHHPLSNYLINKNESNLDYKECEIINLDASKKIIQVEEIIQKIILEKDKNHFISSFYFDVFPTNFNKNLYGKIENFPLEKKEKQFFRNCFSFNEKIELEYEKFLKENRLKEKKYTLFHFRLGDIELLEKEPIEIIEKIKIQTKFKYEIIYNRILMKTNEKIVVLSDSNEFKKFLINKKNKKIVVAKTKSNHCVNKPGFLCLQEKSISIKNMFDLALDLKILSQSKNIISYSSHFWGSGFSFWISKIFDIEIKLSYLS